MFAVVVRPFGCMLLFDGLSGQRQRLRVRGGVRVRADVRPIDFA
ncbi:MAG: hypothetical protein ACK56F_26610 [bacterium]